MVHKTLVFFTAILLSMTLSSGAYSEICGDSTVAKHFADPDQKPIYSSELFNLQRVWLMMAVFDFDEQRVHPAVVDIGFLNDGEHRVPEHECWVDYVPGETEDGIDCDRDIYGAYDGILLSTGIGAFGTHGTNMKNIIAATLNDGGSAGVAGQVAIPNLYRLAESHTYAFELAPTIKKAVDDGSSVINISGGFPCVIQLNLPGISQTPNYCTPEGRSIFCAAPMAASLAGHTALICAASEMEGNLIENVTEAVEYARQRGVPVVASAGNDYTRWLTDFVDITGIINWTRANSDSALWGMLPATAGATIAVGAADSGCPHTNQDFHGSRVNTWGPFTDTSPTAAFVTGLIALAQAINPRLSPYNDNLSGTQKAGLPELLTAMLVESAYRDNELGSFCPSDDPTCLNDPSGQRGNLVNPYRFVRTAAETVVPPFETLNYADSFDAYDIEPETEIDIVGLPNTLEIEENLLVSSVETRQTSGTIFYVPGSTPLIDTDWYTIEYGGVGAGVVSQGIELRFLSGYGDISLSSPHGFLSVLNESNEGDETIRTYQTPEMLHGIQFPVQVHGDSEEDDNLYQLIIKRGKNIAPFVDQYDSPGGNNNAAFPDHNNESEAYTKLEPTEVPQAVESLERRWYISAEELSLHHESDQDHFAFDVLPAPDNGFIYLKHLTLNSGNELVRLYATIGNGDPIALGDAGVYLGADQLARIHAVSKYPGLYLKYKLSGSLRIAPIEHDPLPDKAYTDLKAALEDMQRHMNDRMPEDLTCLRCRVMKDSGHIDLSAKARTIGGYGDVADDARSLNYLPVAETQRVTIDASSNPRTTGHLEIYHASGRRIARSDRGRRLSVELDPGMYFVVAVDSGREAQRWAYQISRTRL